MSKSDGPGTIGYGGYDRPVTTSGIAIAAMIVGILGLVTAIFGIGLLLALLAIVLGAIGIAKTGSPGVRGRGFAITGLVCGIATFVLVIPLLIAILLPSLNRAREAANRIKCASNLRQIGQGMRQYAINDGRYGNFPPDFETVAATTAMTPDAFVCPTSDAVAARPPFALGQNLSYVYLGAGLTDSVPAIQVVAHCETHNHRGDGTNLLYGDGSVRFEQPANYPPEVQPTKTPAG